ncbi:MAG: NUDIX domain-containing protein [Cyanobacteria bacterium]|nr:NUDIX domain-containing protein [Cyanobacteriota bacterium]
MVDDRGVVAAVIVQRNRFLICQRASHKRHGGLWEFPGGKIEPGETLEQAAIRELNEELQLTVVSVGDVLLIVPDTASGYSINFASVETVGDPILTEHQNLGWYSLAELLELELAPSDRTFAHFLSQSRTDKL